MVARTHEGEKECGWVSVILFNKFYVNKETCLESIDYVKNTKYSIECNNTLLVKTSDNFDIDLNIILLQFEMILGA
jgi:hypothetical protein